MIHSDHCISFEDSQVSVSRAIRRSAGPIAIEHAGTQTRGTIGRCEVNALSHKLFALIPKSLIQFLIVDVRSFTKDHVISGVVGDAFYVQSLIPVKYNTIVTDSDNGSGQHKLTLRGTMSESLTRIYLLSDENLVPTTIFFFNDNKWSDTTYGSINPTYSTPIVRLVPRNATVILQCLINRWIPPFSLYTTINKSIYFSITSIGSTWENKTAEFPHILSVEHAYNGEGRLIKITVTRNESVDFYTCNNGDYWLTNVIYWEDPMTTTSMTTTTTTTTTTASTTTSTTMSPEVYITKSMAVNSGDQSATKPFVEDETESMALLMIVGIVVGTICGVILVIVCSLFAWRHGHKSTDGQPKDTESLFPRSGLFRSTAKRLKVFVIDMVPTKNRLIATLIDRACIFKEMIVPCSTYCSIQTAANWQEKV
ncbi:hypothetical protein ACTXT7_009714 [Hymenolepis weldensis]